MEKRYFIYYFVNVNVINIIILINIIIIIINQVALIDFFIAPLAQRLFVLDETLGIDVGEKQKVNKRKEKEDKKKKKEKIERKRRRKRKGKWKKEEKIKENETKKINNYADDQVILIFKKSE